MNRKVDECKPLLSGTGVWSFVKVKRKPKADVKPTSKKPKGTDTVRFPKGK